jgi:hypothetical protein
MEIFCLEDFKDEFDKLKVKKAYRTLEKDIIYYFFNKPIQDLNSGTRLNNSDETPYIKKRLRGSGGYRVYFLILIKKENIYLMFIHPKTGPDGAENITDESKSALYKKVLASIKTNDLYKVTLNKTQDSILFEKL